MKKLTALVLLLACVFLSSGCGQKRMQGDGDVNTQYFFSGEVIEVDDEYLLINVNDVGNSRLSENVEVEVSTDVVSAVGCPDFSVGEYARVLMARYAEDTSERLEALSIYKTDESGKSIVD